MSLSTSLTSPPCPSKPTGVKCRARCDGACLGQRWLGARRGTASSPEIFITPAGRLQSSNSLLFTPKLAMVIISPKQCILGGSGHVAKDSLGAGEDRALGPSTSLSTFSRTGEAAPAASPAQRPSGFQLAPTMMVVSSEALAMTLSLCGHQSISSTGAVCPVTSG